MDYVPILVDYALENDMELVIYVPEYKVYRKFIKNIKEGESQFSETRDLNYHFNRLIFCYNMYDSNFTGPEIWDQDAFNYINIIEKSL